MATYPELCNVSQFKDDRHDWEVLMSEDAFPLIHLDPRKQIYNLSRCKACNLTLLFLDDISSGERAPLKSAQVVHAFYNTRKQ